jgi:hypothetical protein
MRRLWMIAVMAMLGSSPAFAQAGMSVPTPGIAATSPLGMSGGLQPGASVGPTGIPLGATELTSPGISPMLTDPTGTMASGTTCSDGSASTGISGGISGISTYDGGGLAVGGGVGAGLALSGGAAPCVAGSAGTASPAASAPFASPGGVSRSGIPLGSVEIGSVGVSPLLTIPTPTASPSTMTGPTFPSPPTSATPMIPATTGTPTASPVIGAASQLGLPCGALLPSGLANNC